MPGKELDYLTIADAAKAIKAKKLSPVELVQASLDRIGKADKKVNAFITVLRDKALAAARQAEREIAGGKYRGPFHGIPYSLKDIYSTKGVKTTNGSKVFADHVPDYDSTAEKRLRASGGILIGKNGCSEFACGDHASVFGDVHNPWKLDHTPGGSSSGSGASVAAGMVFGSMGSCTGGSIRGPASNNSIVGLKPSYGLVSRYGVFALSWSIDHAGPLTRTVEDCAIMLQAVAGYDANDPSSARAPIPDYRAALDRKIRGLRVGVLKEMNEGVDQEVGPLVQRAIAVLRELGAQVEEISVPVTAEYATVAGNVITWSEAAQVHTPWLEHLEDYTSGARNKVLVGLAIPSVQYHKAQQMRRMVQDELSGILQRVDVVVHAVGRTPPGPLPTPGAGRGESGATRMATERSLTRPYNLTGLPAVSVPCGFSSKGLPVGLHIAGRLFDDATVLKVAHAYEQATEWHNMHPPV